MIPPLTREGILPPGIHWATWDEFAARFGGTIEREQMLTGLWVAMGNLIQAGCQAIYIDGSFVTRKFLPNDYDACWSGKGVDDNLLDPVLLDSSNNRQAQKAKYGGEFFVAEHPANFEGRIVLDFFQRDRKNRRKGIVGIRLNQKLEVSND